MPRSARDDQSSARLFNRALEEGIDLAQAELVLARAEVGRLTKSYIVGVALCLTASALLIATLVILGEAAATGLIPFVKSAPLAYFIAGLGMLLLTFLIVWIGVGFLTRKPKPVGSIFKWLTGEQVKL